jgi:hypothetical protein
MTLRVPEPVLITGPGRARPRITLPARHARSAVRPKVVIGGSTQARWQLESHLVPPNVSCQRALGQPPQPWA